MYILIQRLFGLCRNSLPNRSKLPPHPPWFPPYQIISRLQSLSDVVGGAFDECESLTHFRCLASGCGCGVLACEFVICLKDRTDMR